MAQTSESVYCELPLRSRTRLLLGTAAALLILLVVYLSVRRILPNATGTGFHRFEHVAAFALLGLLLFPLCQTRGQERWVALAVAAFAAALEYGQSRFFINVNFEWWDVRDDVVGLLLAWLLIRSLRRKLV